MNLSPAMQTFIAHWGAMGDRWGVNRSIAQIHALLYLSDDPLPAESIAEILGIARSNVSTALRELQGYGLVETIHVQGDRRDFLRAKQDPWDMVLAIVEERKRREIDPARDMLRDCEAAAAADGGATPKSVRARLTAMRVLVEQLDDLYGRMRRIPRPMLRRVVTLGECIARLVQR